MRTQSGVGDPATTCGYPRPAGQRNRGKRLGVCDLEGAGVQLGLGAGLGAHSAQSPALTRIAPAESEPGGDRVRRWEDMRAPARARFGTPSRPSAQVCRLPALTSRIARL